MLGPDRQGVHSVHPRGPSPDRELLGAQDAAPDPDPDLHAEALARLRRSSRRPVFVSLTLTRREPPRRTRVRAPPIFFLPRKTSIAAVPRRRGRGEVDADVEAPAADLWPSRGEDRRQPDRGARRGRRRRWSAAGRWRRGRDVELAALLGRLPLRVGDPHHRLELARGGVDVRGRRAGGVERAVVVEVPRRIGRPAGAVAAKPPARRLAARRWDREVDVVDLPADPGVERLGADARVDAGEACAVAAVAERDHAGEHERAPVADEQRAARVARAGVRAARRIRRRRRTPSSRGRRRRRTRRRRESVRIGTFASSNTSEPSADSCAPADDPGDDPGCP